MQSQKGFTLIELVITIGVMALVVGLTSGILVAIIRSNHRARLLAEMSRNADNAFSILEENIRSGYDIQLKGGDTSVIEFRDKNNDYKEIGFVAGSAGGVSDCNTANNPNGYLYFRDYDSGGNTPEEHEKITSSDEDGGVNIDSATFAVEDTGVTSVSVNIKMKNSYCNALVEYEQDFVEFVISRVD